MAVFFRLLRPIIALHGWFPVVVILGASEVFSGASMATVGLIGLFSSGRAAE